MTAVSNNDGNKGRGGDDNKKGKEREGEVSETKKNIRNFFNKINKEREAAKGDISRGGPELDCKLYPKVENTEPGETFNFGVLLDRQFLSIPSWENLAANTRLENHSKSPAEIAF